MIVTLTLNPAIDVTITTDEIREGKVNHVLSKREDIGGKGINVSKTLKALGTNSHVVCFTAGKNGEKIKDYLQKNDYSFHTIDCEGETRENIKIIHQEGSGMVEINEKGPTASETHIHALTRHLDKTLKKGDVLVLSGSAPKGIKSTIYQTLILRYKPKGILTVLDASKDLLKEALTAGPYLIKPNEHEFSDYFNEPFDPLKLKPWLSHFHDLGIKLIFLSLGKDGAYASNQEDLYYAVPLHLIPLSTVGAGDAFVAGLIHHIDTSLDKMLKYASCVSSGAVMTEGTNPASLETVKTLYKKINVRKVLL